MSHYCACASVGNCLPHNQQDVSRNGDGGSQAEDVNLIGATGPPGTKGDTGEGTTGTTGQKGDTGDTGASGSTF